MDSKEETQWTARNWRKLESKYKKNSFFPQDKSSRLILHLPIKYTLCSEVCFVREDHYRTAFDEAHLQVAL